MNHDIYHIFNNSFARNNRVIKGFHDTTQNILFAMEEKPDEETEQQDKATEITQTVEHNVFKDGKTMYGKQVRPQVIESYTKYYQVCFIRLSVITHNFL